MSLDIIVDSEGNIRQDASKENKISRKINVLFEGEPESEAVCLQKSELPNCIDAVRKFDEGFDLKIKGDCNDVASQREQRRLQHNLVAGQRHDIITSQDVAILKCTYSSARIPIGSY